MVRMVIELAVAEARCTGPYRETVASLRPAVMRGQSRAIRKAGQAMMQRYREVHGDAWASALMDDLHRLRTAAEQRPDLDRFCGRTAWRARLLASDFGGGSNFRGMDVESSMYALGAR
jgi:hypothetical protein